MDEGTWNIGGLLNKQRSLFAAGGVFLLLTLYLNAGCSCDKSKPSECPDVILSVTPLQGREPMRVNISVTVEDNPYSFIGVATGDSFDWIYSREFSDDEAGSTFSESFTHVFNVAPGALENDYPVVVTALKSDGQMCSVRSSVNVRKNLPLFVQCDSRQINPQPSCSCNYTFRAVVYDDADFGPIMLDTNGDGIYDYNTTLTGTGEQEFTFDYCYISSGIYSPVIGAADDGGYFDSDECEQVICSCVFDYFNSFMAGGSSQDILPLSYNGRLYAVVNHSGGGTWIIDVTDPDAPVFVTRIPAVSGDMVIHFYGTRPVLFIAYGGIRMYDLSDPANPVLIPSSNTLTLNTRRLDVEDSPAGVTVVYLMQDYDTVYACDVSDPDNFQGFNQCKIINIRQLTGAGTTLVLNDVAVLEDAVSGDHYVFVSHYGEDVTNKLFVARVRVSPSISVIGTASFNFRPESYPVEKVEIMDSSRLLYAVEWPTCTATNCPFGLRVYSIYADPLTSAPAPVTGCEFNDNYDGGYDYNHYYPKIVRDAYPFSDTVAYIAWDYHGWEEIYVLPGTGCVESNAHFCSQLKEGLPGAITCVYPSTGVGRAYGIARADQGGRQIVLTAGMGRGISLHDLSPASIVFDSHLDLSNVPVDLEGFEPSAILLTAEGDGGISVFDFRNIDAANDVPPIIARIDEEASITRLSTTENQYLYALAGGNSVYVYSITQPENPRRIATISGGGNVICLDAYASGTDDYLWMCAPSGTAFQLKVYKRTGDVLSLVAQSGAFIDSSNTFIASGGDSVYVISNTSIYRFDGANPSGTVSPVAKAYLPASMYPTAVAASFDGQYLYVALGTDLKTAVYDVDLNLLKLFEGDIGSKDNIKDMLYIEGGSGLSISRYLVEATEYNGVIVLNATDPSTLNLSAISPSNHIRRAYYLSTLRLPAMNYARVYIVTDNTGEVSVYNDTCR